MRGPEIRNTHPYLAAPGTWPTTPPCTCGFPKGWRGHAEAPEPDPEAAVIDARILGETEEQQREGDSS